MKNRYIVSVLLAKDGNADVSQADTSVFFHSSAAAADSRSTSGIGRRLKWISAVI